MKMDGKILLSFQLPIDIKKTLVFHHLTLTTWGIKWGHYIFNPFAGRNNEIGLTPKDTSSPHCKLPRSMEEKVIKT